MTNFSFSWLNGISALLLIISAWILVGLCINYYIKNKKGIYLGGILLFSSIGVGWLGISLSFLSIEFTGDNQQWIEFIIPFFSYCSIPAGSFAITYSVWDLVGSKETKKKILLIYVFLSIIYYIIFVLSIPLDAIELYVVEGTVIDDWVKPNTIFYLSVWILTSITTTISLMGFAKMNKQMTGELKTRSNMLLIASPIFALCVLADTVVLGSLIHYHLNFLFIVRFSMIVSIILIMYAFRPISMKPTLLTIPLLIIVFAIFFFFIGLENGI